MALHYILAPNLAQLLQIDARWIVLHRREKERKKEREREREREKERDKYSSISDGLSRGIHYTDDGGCACI